MTKKFYQYDRFFVSNRNFYYFLCKSCLKFQFFFIFVQNSSFFQNFSISRFFGNPACPGRDVKKYLSGVRLDNQKVRPRTKYLERLLFVV